MSKRAHDALARLEKIADIVDNLAYAVGCGLEGTRTAKNIREAVATVRAELERGAAKEETPEPVAWQVEFQDWYDPAVWRAQRPFRTEIEAEERAAQFPETRDKVRVVPLYTHPPKAPEGEGERRIEGWLVAGPEVYTLFAGPHRDEFVSDPTVKPHAKAVTVIFHDKPGSRGGA